MLKSHRSSWSFEKIKNGCDRFFLENSRYPTSHDFDLTEYLPSSVTIRKRYGSFPEFRKILGQKIENYSCGHARSEIVRGLTERAITDENFVYEKLKLKYGEMHVHREKEYAFRSRVDFYVYCKRGYFAIDSFYPCNSRSLPNIFNIKEKKYINFIGDIYLVVMNPDISEQMVLDFLKRRRKTTPSHIHLVCLSKLDQLIDSIDAI